MTTMIVKQWKVTKHATLTTYNTGKATNVSCYGIRYFKLRKHAQDKWRRKSAGKWRYMTIMKLR